MEWIVVLKRIKEEELRSDLNDALSILKVMGEVMVETYGAEPSLIAAKVGSRQHFTFTESDQVASVFLPVFSFGEQNSLLGFQDYPKRTLMLHRQDGSIHHYDHFNRKFLAYNALVTGKSGSGKSVLANALSSSLLEDENIFLVKIDVGGSYKKECEIYGGQEIDFSLDSPSGINPFSFFREFIDSNEAISTLTTFLSTLILEQDERILPKLIQAEIEKSLKNYSEKLSNGDEGSIDHFIVHSPGFPRLELLKRWAKGGVFENALKESGSTDTKNRYRYYNFENIGSASNKDFSEGIMAAVMAQINLEMIRISKNKNLGQRMVLICDETKFFIERNAPFFLLTTANFRKFGHGVILIAQNIRNFEINIDGQIDRGLILNSPIRFFFQADTEADYLMNQFNFNERQIDSVVKNPYSGKDYREAVLQDDTGSRMIRLALTQAEYWRMSSSKEDSEKLEKLKKAVPGLSLSEAITCLSMEKK
jgi:conjugal transfer ATP-binding protein TraC